MSSIGRLALTLVLCGTAGCGSRLAPVRGKVTYREKPVTVGNILFVPDAGGATATADIQKDGTYVLRTGDRPGAAPGRYKVMIVSMQDTSGQLPEQRNPLPGLLIPEKYSDMNRSGLIADVKDQENEIDFPLK